PSIYTLSLHDALPIYTRPIRGWERVGLSECQQRGQTFFTTVILLIDASEIFLNLLASVRGQSVRPVVGGRAREMKQRQGLLFGISLVLRKQRVREPVGHGRLRRIRLQALSQLRLGFGPFLLGEGHPAERADRRGFCDG